jgi:hypothetical protein
MAEIATTLIATFGGVAIACITYSLTKMRERDAELRKEKLEHYKELVAGLSGIVRGEETPEGHRAYARACNKLNLVAPQPVLKALYDFRQATVIGNTDQCDEKSNRMMSLLLREMRNDLQIRPKDQDRTFEFCLWTAGVPSEK